MPRRRSPLDDPLITTAGRLLEASAAVERRSARTLEAGTGLPLGWFEVLLRVARSDGQRLMMSELSQQLALTTGGVTRLVDRIVEAGYLERGSAEHDRRVVLAVLTPEGHSAVERAAAVHAEDLADVFRRFSAADVRRLDALLDRLRDV